MLGRTAKAVALIIAVMATAAFDGRDVEFPSAKLLPASSSQVVSARFFKPDTPGAPYPAVVLLHGCGGATDLVTRAWPDFLTGLGYAVVVPLSYASRGAETCDAFPRFDRYLIQVEDAFGALYYFGRRDDVDAKRVALIGFSAGAVAINGFMIAQVIQKSYGPNFRAAVSVFGHCNNLFVYAESDIPLAQIVGDYDAELIPSCASVARHTGMEIHNISGGGHVDTRAYLLGAYSNTVRDRLLAAAGGSEEVREIARRFFARHVLTPQSAD